MVDAWRGWDERVRSTGRPERVAHESTDEELVALLRAHSQQGREPDLRIVADELDRRLRRARGPGPAELPQDETRERIRETLG